MNEKNKSLDEGLNIHNKKDWKRAVAVDHVIDTNKRSIKDKVNTSEPKFTK